MAELVLQAPYEAEREFRDGYAAFAEMGERAQLSTMAAFLARALVVAEHYDEVERLTVLSQEAASVDDLASQALWRGTRARVFARRGELESAERLAREAVEFAHGFDFISTRADVLMDLAYVLGVARSSEADEVAAEALVLYEAKGNLSSAAAARAAMDAWRGRSPA